MRNIDEDMDTDLYYNAGVALTANLDLLKLRGRQAFSLDLPRAFALKAPSITQLKQVPDALGAAKWRLYQWTSRSPIVALEELDDAAK